MCYTANVFYTNEIIDFQTLSYSDYNVKFSPSVKCRLSGLVNFLILPLTKKSIISDSTTLTLDCLTYTFFTPDRHLITFVS